MLKQRYHFKFIILIIIFSCALCLLIGLYKAFTLPHIKAYFEARKSLKTKSVLVPRKQEKEANPNTDNKPLKRSQSVTTNSNNINYTYKETTEEKRLRERKEEKQLKKEVKVLQKQLKKEAKEEKRQAKQEAKIAKQKIKEEQKLKKKNNEVQKEPSSSTQYSEVIFEE